MSLRDKFAGVPHNLETQSPNSRAHLQTSFGVAERSKPHQKPEFVAAPPPDRERDRRILQAVRAAVKIMAGWERHGESHVSPTSSNRP
jgi:hypothetical protein